MSIKLPKNVTKIVGSHQTIYLLEDGTVWGCGLNSYGQLGLGNTTSPIKTPVKLNISNVKDVACNNSSTVFLLNDGTVYGCGYNNYGELGLGTKAQQITPVKLSLSNVNKIVCGQAHLFYTQ